MTSRLLTPLGRAALRTVDLGCADPHLDATLWSETMGDYLARRGLIVKSNLPGWNSSPLTEQGVAAAREAQAVAQADLRALAPNSYSLSARDAQGREWASAHRSPRTRAWLIFDSRGERVIGGGIKDQEVARTALLGVAADEIAAVRAALESGPQGGPRLTRALVRDLVRTLPYAGRAALRAVNLTAPTPRVAADLWSANTGRALDRRGLVTFHKSVVMNWRGDLTPLGVRAAAHLQSGPPVRLDESGQDFQMVDDQGRVLARAAAKLHAGTRDTSRWSILVGDRVVLSGLREFPVAMDALRSVAMDVASGL